VRGKATNSAFSEKRGTNSKNPPTKSTKNLFFIPALFHPLRINAVPPSDTPDDAMSGEAGPAPGWRALAGTNPRPAATVSLWTKGLTRVMGSDAPKPGYPDRKDVPQRHTNKAPALSRTSRQRGETNGGDEGRASNGKGSIPRARVPAGMVHHPAGTSRATGQAMADIPRGGLCHSWTRARSSLVLGSSPRMTRAVAALPERRMQREETPNEAPEGAT
jgi:hypothetical protein